MSTEPKQDNSYVFLSYASVDRERALHIANLLEAQKIPVWVDRKSIPGGTSWSGEIVRGIEGSSAFILLVSKAAMASPNVQQEVQLAWETQRPILPLVVEQANPPESIRYALAGRQWLEVLDQPDDDWVPQVVQALGTMEVSSVPPQAPTGDRRPDQLASSLPPPGLVRSLTNLPVGATRFIGREREVAAACQEIQRPEVRLLTLTGPGGVGKTRLALEVAARVAPAFPGGVFFVPLATVSDPGLVAPTIAQTLGVRESGLRPVLESLQAFLSQKPCLLVLDNYEQIVESASLLGQLLAACPHLTILVTSRSTLNAYGEQEFPVDPLALPPTEPLPPLDQLAQYDAIRLFVERAQAVKPNFALSQTTAATVAAICWRLDGLPLAIELAAARIRLFPPAALLARLDHRLKLLTGGPTDRPLRQQTLRGAIAWSYDLLDPSERRLFQRLSAFVGGFDLTSAEAVCSAVGELDVDLLDGLDSLVGKSLVRTKEGTDEPIFMMLSTIREYGLERLDESGEAEKVREAHAAYFLSLSEQAARSSSGPDAASWLARLSAVVDNLRAALDYLRSLPETAERVPRELGASLNLGALLLANAGQGSAEAKALYDRALALVQDLPGSPELARALFGLWTFYLFRGEMGTASGLVQRILELAQRTHDREALMQSHFAASATVYWLGEFEATVEHAREVVTYYDPTQHSGYLIRYAQNPRITAMADATWALWILGFPDEALAMARETEAIARELAHEFMTVISLHLAPGLFQHMHDLPQLAATVQPYLERARRLGNPVYVALGEGFAGWLSVAQGQQAEGLAQIRQARGLFLGMGVGLVEPLMTTLHADACLQAGAIVEGLAVLDGILKVADQNQQLAYTSEQFRLRGELFRVAAPGSHAEALSWFEQALAVSRRQHARSFELRAAMSLARLWRDQGDPTRGREVLASTYAWFTEGLSTPDLQAAAKLLGEL